MLIIDFISEAKMRTWPDVLYGQIPFNKLALSFEVTEVVVIMM